MHSLSMTDPAARVIARALARQAEEHGDAVFLRADEQSVTFSAAAEASGKLAGGLSALGVRKGSGVAFMMENSLDLVLTSLGVNHLGGFWIPTNTAYKGDWLAHALADGEGEALVIDEAFLPRLEPIADALPFKHIIVNGRVDPDLSLGGRTQIPLSDLSESDAVGIGDVNYDDLAAVLWTSGTTGRAKGVMQSNSCWLASVEIINRGRDVREGDAFYCCLPMYNSGGWVLNVYAALQSGLPVGIDQAFSVSSFWDRTRHYEATQVVTLGAMHMFLWQLPASDADRANPVRAAIFAPLPVDLVEPMRDRWGIDYIATGIGQSEMMPYAIMRRGTTYKPGSCGTAREDLDVRLLDEEDEEVGVGEVGEICIRPKRPNVMFSGYFRQPDVTLQAFRNLWYHSGDLGRFDEDGELYFVDRKADFMRYKGRNISSFEVEAVVGQHPKVAAVAAFGVPAAEIEHEEEVKVCVVAREGESLDPDELARFVNDNAPYYLVPRFIELLDALPMTPTGRVRKFELRAAGNSRAWDRDASGFVVER